MIANVYRLPEKEMAAFSRRDGVHQKSCRNILSVVKS